MEKNSTAKSLMHFVVKEVYNEKTLLLTLHNKMALQSGQIELL